MRDLAACRAAPTVSTARQQGTRDDSATVVAVRSTALNVIRPITGDPRYAARRFALGAFDRPQVRCAMGRGPDEISDGHGVRRHVRGSEITLNSAL